MHSNHSASPKSARRAVGLAGLALATLTLSISAAFAAPVFDKPDADFNGSVRTQGALPGAEATLMGRGFTPGQKVTLYRGGEALNNGEAYTVNEKGTFEAKVAIPAEAVPGLHAVVASAANPSAASVFDLKVINKLPLSAEDKFTVTSQKLVPGLYQSAYSAKNDRLYVTSAVGRPPVKDSRLLKINPQTLAIEAEVTVAVVPSRQDGHRYAVYGVDVDDAHNNVWVSNTRDNTVAVYKQSDLKLVKQFDAGLAPHARDIAIDEKLNKAFVSTPGKNTVEVFDTKKLAHAGTISIDSDEDKSFNTMSLALDATGHKLYTVSGSTSEAAVIDTKTNKVERVVKVPGVKSGAGIAIDAKGKRLYVVAQGSDNLVIVDLESGKPLYTVEVGQGALNVAFDPKSGLAYVVSRGAGTVTVVNGEGKIVGNLDGGTFPNHVIADGKGDVFVINKSRGADDAKGDRISRILPKQ